MTISRQDVQDLSSGPAPGGIPLPADQADRIAAVLNQQGSRRSTPGLPPRRLTDRPVPAAQAPAIPAPRGSRRTRKQVLDMMRRAGYATAQIEAAADLLPDTVDLEQDRALLAAFALSTGELMDRMGSSP